MMLLFIGGPLDGDIWNVSGDAPPEIQIPRIATPAKWTTDGDELFVELKVYRYVRAERWSSPDWEDAAYRYRLERSST